MSFIEDRSILYKEISIEKPIRAIAYEKEGVPEHLRSDTPLSHDANKW